MATNQRITDHLVVMTCEPHEQRVLGDCQLETHLPSFLSTPVASGPYSHLLH